MTFYDEFMTFHFRRQATKMSQSVDLRCQMMEASRNRNNGLQQKSWNSKRQSDFLSLPLLQKFVGDLFYFFAGKLAGTLRDFLDPQNRN